MSRISPSEYKKLLPEDIQKLFNDLTFNLMRYGGVKMNDAEEMALTEFLKVKNMRWKINYSTMTNTMRDSFVSNWALSILDESKKKKLFSCKRCGIEMSSDSRYCDKCNGEFDAAIKNGALILYNPTFRTESNSWEIRRYSSSEPDKRVFYKEYHFNQIQAIMEARKIAKRKSIDKIVYEGLPDHSRWFLDEYLEAHTNLKEDIQKSEMSIWKRLREYTNKVIK